MLAIYAVRSYIRSCVGYRFIFGKGVQTLSVDKTEEVPTLFAFYKLTFSGIGVAKRKWYERP